MTPTDPRLADFARAVVSTVLPGRAVVDVHARAGSGGATVLVVTLADAHRLVLKVADPDPDPDPDAGRLVDFQRTAAVATLARAAGVPTPAVLAADDSGRAGRRHLLYEHLEGVPWRQVRPRMDPSQVTAAHREIAAAVLSLQSVRFESFGEFDRRGRPGGPSLLDALHRRTDLRVGDPRARESLHHVLHRDAELFARPEPPTLCHDDLHHDNVLFRRRRRGGWELAGFLDWDKAWAGSAESDVARMAFWDDMTGPGFWQVYRSAVPATDGHRERASIYQLLWCLEYDDGSPRHAADTAALRRRLALP